MPHEWLYDLRTCEIKRLFLPPPQIIIEKKKIRYQNIFLKKDSNLIFFCQNLIFAKILFCQNFIFTKIQTPSRCENSDWLLQKNDCNLTYILNIGLAHNYYSKLKLILPYVSTCSYFSWIFKKTYLKGHRTIVAIVNTEWIVNSLLG